MHAVLREEGSVVVEINASLSMTIALEASDKDHASDGHVLGEDEPVVEIQLGSTGASHDGVVVLVAVSTRVQEVVHFERFQR